MAPPIMNATLRHWRVLRSRAPFLALSVLALALAARVFAFTALAAAPGAGVVPLCLGGQIVYVTLEGYDGPTEPVEGTETVVCPWLGMGPDQPAAPLWLPHPQPLIAGHTDAPGLQLGATGRHDAYDPRAPPTDLRT